MKKYTIAIVLAAGQGKRMNADKPKQYLLVKEKPILYSKTGSSFEECINNLEKSLSRTINLSHTSTIFLSNSFLEYLLYLSNAVS